MTDKSICVRCAELIRVKVKRNTSFEIKLCPFDVIAMKLYPDDTVEECSRFVEMPGGEVKGK